MILQIHPDLRVLEDGEMIPEAAVCYGEMASGAVGWCKPGALAGTRWNKHSIRTLSIIMADSVTHPAPIVFQMVDAPRGRHPRCEGNYDAHTGDHDCGYDTRITCDECLYGLGGKDPAAECNQM